MYTKKRKGVALVIVLLLSAFMLGVIALIMTLTDYSYKAQSAVLSSDKALTVAEGGTSKLINELRTDRNGTATMFSNMVPYDVAEIGPELVDNYSFYWIKLVCEYPIKELGGGKREFTFDTYVLGGISKTDISNLNSEQLKTAIVDSRRIVHLTIVGDTDVTTQVILNPPTAGDTTMNNSIFNYGFFTGGSFSLAGGCDVTNASTGSQKGNIYTSGGFSCTGSHTFTKVYINTKNGSSNTTKGIKQLVGYPAGTTVNGIQTWVDEMTPPTINYSFYQNMFQAFVNGTYPYNGTVANYPNTSNPQLNTQLKTLLFPGGMGSYTYAVADDPINPTSTRPYYYVTPTNLQNFCQTVQENINIPPYNTFGDYTKMNAACFYVRPQSTTGTTPGSISLGSTNYLAGTIVTPDDVSFQGQTSQPAGSTVSLLTGGNITITGGSDLTGVFYASGDSGPGKGSFSVEGNGRLIGVFGAKNGIDFSGHGNATITLKQDLVNDLPNLSIIGGGIPDPNLSIIAVPGFKTVKAEKDGWKETDWSTFSNIEVE